MFRAEIRWLENGPTLKMEGKLASDWAQQAMDLVTRDLVPKGLLVELTEVSYVDSAGEQFLKWLASVGAVFAARSVYAIDVCERLRLSTAQRKVKRHKRKHGNNEEISSIRHSGPIEAI